MDLPCIGVSRVEPGSRAGPSRPPRGENPSMLVTDVGLLVSELI